MLNRPFSRRRACKPQPQHRRKAILRVEQLEDRNLMDAGATGLDASTILVRFRAEAVEQGLVRPALEGTQIGAALPLVDGLFEVTVSAGVNLDDAIAAYRADANVLFAEPNFQLVVDWIPNDTNFGDLWGLNNTGQNFGRVDADIDAAEAWNTTTGSRTIIVAVIDTGIDYNHPDLAANMWRNSREIAGNGFDDDRNGFVDDVYGADFHNNDGNPMDDNRHGTHVAGTIGAVGNNARGVIGVSPNVQLMGLKFLAANGSGSTSNAIRAIDYAIANGAKIINASWGGGGGAQGDALYQAIQRARNAGVIFVAAAGNAGANNDVTGSWPANYNLDNVISVAATDRNDNLASFSNYGATKVHLAAPGVSILSTTPNGNYASYSGTSMATPHVAGAAALVWAANPNWTYAQVRSRLLATVDRLASLQNRVSTGGRLNVGSAVAGSSPTPPPPADTTGARVTAASWLTEGQGVRGLRVTFSESIASFTAADVVVTGPNGQALTGVAVGRVSGTQNQFDITFATQTAPGAYNATIGPNATDNANNRMDQDQDGNKGEASEDQYRTTYTIASSGTFTFAANNVNAAIRDYTSTYSTIFVNQNVRISDMDIRFDITHTYDSDLQIYLTSPTGTTYLLVNRRGGSGDNFQNTILDDEASRTLGAGAAPFAGSYRPDRALSGFDGQLSYGNWTLRVYDADRTDIGTLRSWSLTLSGQVVALSGRAGARGLDGAEGTAVESGESWLDGSGEGTSDKASFAGVLANEFGSFTTPTTYANMESAPAPATEVTTHLAGESTVDLFAPLAQDEEETDQLFQTIAEGACDLVMGLDLLAGWCEAEAAV
jgi:subtilisin family serine protease/subtilisin-like proprotein convertase family protein